jgi:hypothetical protein
MRILNFADFLFEATMPSEIYAIGAKGEEVKKIQQKLIDLGFLKISAPTGNYQEQTKQAVMAFQKSKGLEVDGIIGQKTYPILMGTQPAAKFTFTPPPSLTVAQSDTFSQYDTVAKEKGRVIDVIRKVKPILQKNNISDTDFETGNWITRLIKKSMKSIPLHIRAMIYYLAGRTAEMNEDELTSEERAYLYQAAKTHGLASGFDYAYWKSAGAADLPTAVTTQGIQAETERIRQAGKADSSSLALPNLAGQFMYTIGSVSKQGVQKRSSDIIVSDNYDMNVVESGTKAEDLLKSVANTVDLWSSDKASLYSLIRQTIALREILGYKGYPVKFDLKSPSQTA